MSDTSKLQAKIRRLEKFLRKGVPRVVGVEAKKHFQKSFRKSGFTDRSLKKWANPKRKDPISSWYGFTYGSTAIRPGRNSKKGSITNYSQAATKRKVLIGENQELKNSITYKISSNTVILTSDRPYSKLINEGGPMKVFGKSGAQMPKRQFMGKSAALNKKIKTRIINRIKTILN